MTAETRRCCIEKKDKTKSQVIAACICCERAIISASVSKNIYMAHISRRLILFVTSWLPPVHGMRLAGLHHCVLQKLQLRLTMRELFYMCLAVVRCCCCFIRRSGYANVPGRRVRNLCMPAETVYSNQRIATEGIVSVLLSR